MSDLISRQSAIRRYCSEHCGCEPQDCGLTMEQDGAEECDFVRFLREEPSAQPEQKTGQWIKAIDELGEAWSCSVCATEYTVDEMDSFREWARFCPNCGARMEETDDGKDT